MHYKINASIRKKQNKHYLSTLKFMGLFRMFVSFLFLVFKHNFQNKNVFDKNGLKMIFKSFSKPRKNCQFGF